MENRLNHKTQVRIPGDLYRKIVRMAEADGRSINGEIVFLLYHGEAILREALASPGTAQPAPPSA